MNAVPPPKVERGLSLLAAHCASLDPDAPSARQRLEQAVGPELARKLLLGLCAAAPAQNAA